MSLSKQETREIRTNVTVNHIHTTDAINQRGESYRLVGAERLHPAVEQRRLVEDGSHVAGVAQVEVGRLVPVPRVIPPPGGRGVAGDDVGVVRGRPRVVELVEVGLDLLVAVLVAVVAPDWKKKHSVGNSQYNEEKLID